jgi:hypothetical protein
MVVGPIRQEQGTAPHSNNNNDVRGRTVIRLFEHRKYLVGGGQENSDCDDDGQATSDAVREH